MSLDQNKIHRTYIVLLGRLLVLLVVLNGALTLWACSGTFRSNNKRLFVWIHSYLIVGDEANCLENYELRLDL